MSSGDDKTLDGAYALETPEDSVRLYRDWAATYDQSFAESHGYAVPPQLAAIFRDAGGAGPVLDVGAGTGLAAEALGAILPGIEIDGIDISQEMLDVAAAKGLYRARIRADLTQTLDLPDASYGGLISAGTFTHGHVGAVCLPELVRVARPGAVFAFSIRTQVFDDAGFGSAFAGLVADGALSPLSFRKIPLYRDDADHEHARDIGLVAVFTRL